MPRPSDARSRLIRVAAALFRQRGYDGIGLAEILQASGAPKGSFYHHFPAGKEQLAEACIAHAGEQVGALIDAAMADAPDFAAGVRRLVQGIADWFERSGFREGCPITSIALATVPQSPAHTAAVQAAFAGWQERLLGHAHRLGARFDATDAERLLMLIEGAWILSRVRQSTEPLQRAVDSFLGSPPSAIRAG
jgi:TetR/AcrR family transcriptional regulator, lmrAB and yxaGH operons repressor